MTTLQQNRQPKGTPVGGQFAAAPKAAADFALRVDIVEPDHEEYAEARRAAERANDAIYDFGKKCAVLEVQRIFREAREQGVGSLFIDVGEKHVGERAVYPSPYVTRVDGFDEVPDRWALALSELRSIDLMNAGARTDYTRDWRDRTDVFTAGNNDARAAELLAEGADIDIACEEMAGAHGVAQDQYLRAVVHQTLCEAVLDHDVPARALLVQMNDDGDQMRLVGLLDGDGQRLDTRENWHATDFVEGVVGGGHRQDSQDDIHPLNGVGDIDRWFRAGLIDPHEFDRDDWDKQYVVDLSTVRAARGL